MYFEGSCGSACFSIAQDITIAYTLHVPASPEQEVGEGENVARADDEYLHATDKTQWEGGRDGFKFTDCLSERRIEFGTLFLVPNRHLFSCIPRKLEVISGFTFRRFGLVLRCRSGKACYIITGLTSACDLLHHLT